MRVLVTGGTGYVGGFVCRLFKDAGWEVHSVDNLHCSSNTKQLHDLGVRTHVNDFSVPLTHVFSKSNPLDLVIHLAALTIVEEGERLMSEYLDVNAGRTMKLLKHLHHLGCQRMIFASTGAVYGVPKSKVLREDQPVRPVCWYGHTKAVAEAGLDLFTRQIQGFQSVSFRFFNVAGAWDNIGERRGAAETHLIPRMIRAVHGGPMLKVFRAPLPHPSDLGDTPVDTVYLQHLVDQGCVRDYIHGRDIAGAMLLAARKMLDFPEWKGGTYNLGTGVGHSTVEMVKKFEAVARASVPWELSNDSRPGDVYAEVADPSKAQYELGWKAQYGIEPILESAYEFAMQERFNSQPK